MQLIVFHPAQRSKSTFHQLIVFLFWLQLGFKTHFKILLLLSKSYNRYAPPHSSDLIGFYAHMEQDAPSD